MMSTAPGEIQSLQAVVVDFELDLCELAIGHLRREKYSLAQVPYIRGDDQNLSVISRWLIQSILSLNA